MAEEEHPGAEALPAGLSVEKLCEIVRNGPQHQQVSAMQHLMREKDNEDVHSCIRDAFANEKEKTVRIGAARVLCAMFPRQVDDIVTETLTDPDLRPCGMWWGALCRKLKVPLDACRAGMSRDTGAANRRHAAHLMRRQGEEGKAELLRLLSEGESDEKATAALIVDAEKHPEAFDVLWDELLNGHRNRKWLKMVGQRLIWSFPERFADHLNSREKLAEEKPELAWVLARWRMSRNQETVDDVLLAGQPDEKKSIIKSYAKKAGPDAIPILRACLKATGPRKVTGQVFRELLRLKDEAVPVAIEMLDSDCWAERKAGVGVLRRLGQLTDAQRDMALSDPHIAVRHACIGGRWIDSP